MCRNSVVVWPFYWLAKIVFLKVFSSLVWQLSLQFLRLKMSKIEFLQNKKIIFREITCVIVIVNFDLRIGFEKGTKVIVIGSFFECEGFKGVHYIFQKGGIRFVFEGFGQKLLDVMKCFNFELLNGWRFHALFCIPRKFSTKPI